MRTSNTQNILLYSVILVIYKSESEAGQLCPTLCDPMDYSLPGSSVHGIFQERIVEWVAISFSRRSSQPRDWTRVSCIVGRRFTIWASREAIKKAKRQRIEAFELWCWRRLWRVCKEIQPVHPLIQEISPEYSLEGLMPKLKLQYFGHLMWRADSLEKAGGEGDDRGWDGWMASPTQWTWVRVNSRSWWWTGMPGVLQTMGLPRFRHDWATELNLIMSDYFVRASLFS